MSVKTLIDKWESEQRELKPYIKALGVSMPKSSMIAYSVRQKCIDELKEYQKEMSSNGSINH